MKRIKPTTRAIVMACACAIGSLLAASGHAAPIQRIYLVHFSHTDFGFTDLQSVCRDLQVRYLDMAIDAVNATANGPEERKFRWTAESTVAVGDWWAAASPSATSAQLSALPCGHHAKSLKAGLASPYCLPYDV